MRAMPIVAANELAGKAKQAAGDATNNNSLRTKGAAQEAKAVPSKPRES